MTHIIDSIWLGSQMECVSRTFLTERKITHVLCCASEIQCPPVQMLVHNEILWDKLPLMKNYVDGQTENMLMEGANILHTWISNGYTSMVMCDTGDDRSIAILLTYLMVYNGWSYTIALSFLRHKKYRIRPYHGYIAILLNIESRHSQKPALGDHLQGS